MAEVYAPIAKDESFKTSESTSRNVADVLAQELARIAENILPPNAEDIAYDNTASGLTATNVQDAIDEVISSQADVIADTMADLTENKTATVTDGVADFETIDGSLVKSLVVSIEPSQSGSGTPSPSNIRPISGYTEEVISVKDSTDTTQETYTTPFNQTVYGGTLDVLTGELTIDKGFITLNGTENCSKSVATDSDTYMYTINTADFDSPFILSAFQYTEPNPNYRVGYAWRGSSNTQIRIGFAEYGTTTIESWKAWLSNNPLQIAYTLATPTTISLTPQTVKSLVGENHIQASTGEVTECKFSMLINGDDLAQIMGG